jgi:hypothetical protein
MTRILGAMFASALLSTVHNSFGVLDPVGTAWSLHIPLHMASKLKARAAAHAQACEDSSLLPLTKPWAALAA